MAKVKVPFVVADEKQTDDYNLTSYSRQQINGYFSLGIASDGSTTANWNKRPGMLEWCDLGVAAKVDGLYWWPRQQKIVATCGGRTFFVNQDGTFNEKTGTATMVAGVRPTYADIDGTTLYRASSGQDPVLSFPLPFTNDTVDFQFCLQFVCGPGLGCTPLSTDLP